ncbi:MAG: tetratricopeptide repeat protein, partial [Armatimonadota bacterium]
MRSRSSHALGTTVVLVAWALALLSAAGAQAASVAQATELVAAGRVAEAAQMLEAIVSASAEDLGARFWLGRCRAMLGDLEGAAQALQSVLDVKPSSVESRYWLGEVRRRQGRLGEARTLLEQVLAANPEHAQAKSALAAVRAEIERQERMLGPVVSDWVLPTEHSRIALDTAGLAVPPGAVNIYSDHVYDYTFSDPPTDWVACGGQWEATSRWTCSPQWSWFGGFSSDGVAAVWNKRQFTGDITVEAYCAFKMGVVPTARNYRNPNDMNVTICGDGANLDSGYSFIYGGELNSTSRIMRGTQVLAESREPESMLPIFEDGYPSTYEFHRKWWMLRVRKSGELLQLWVDGRLIAEARDPQPLEGGRLA